MKKRIYISGKIGDPHNPEVRNKFAHAAKQLASAGYEPVNPFDNGLPSDSPWIEHMLADLQILTTCDGVQFLPDWRESDGARIEALFTLEFFCKSPKFPLLQPLGDHHVLKGYFFDK